MSTQKSRAALANLGRITGKQELGPCRGRRSQLNFQLAEYHGMIGEGYVVLRGWRSS